MEFKGQKVLVVGAGKSGIAAVKFLLGKGASVTLTDINENKRRVSAIGELAAQGVIVRFGEYPQVRPRAYDYVVVSPGVPLTIEPILDAVKSDIPVMGELELAFTFAQAPVIAITGTNGKTTTTTLTGEIFKDADFTTLVAGNIGKPLVEEVEQYNNSGVIVAEVSSFQLESTATFAPRVSAILNITPDHLDRHGTLLDYVRAKERVFKGQGTDDYTVLNYDDPILVELAARCPGEVIFFSRKNILDRGVFLENDKIVSIFKGIRHEIMCAKDLGIPGPHNLENALAAIACASVFAIEPGVIARTLRNFQGVEHRLEFVREFGGVGYINDSKGTNPDAAIKALESFSQPIVLIAGGQNKGNDFLSFAQKIKERARLVITLGQCAHQIEDALQTVGFASFIGVDTFKEAVLAAKENAYPGEVVLLSPACASWDMFDSYEERGELFKEIVNNLR